jgi:branched-chain amino acid transport system ATP-binding protein/neutral amino acid transport system ATP-binding protein
MTALLTVNDLHVSYGKVEAVTGVSLQMQAGQILTVIGPNGAGKTTLFNCITGVVPPHRGRILFAGADIAGLRPDQISSRGLARTFQIARGLPRLSVIENLMLYAPRQRGERLLSALLRPAAARRQEEALVARAVAIARRLNLYSVLANPASDLSGGQKKLLEIGRVLMSEPKLILLDEPVAGVNPTLAREIGAHLKALASEGLTILLIEHHLDMVARLCDHVIVLAEGRRLAEGSFAAVAADPAVQEAYMGRRRAGVP